MAARLLAAAWTCAVGFADGEIDPLNKHAWTENAGWQNFADAHGSVMVHPHGAQGYLSGYAWAENVGWIKLGAGAGPYANTTSGNYGVNMDTAGNLSGYAWSETCGWLNFNSTHSRVTINQATGYFDGYAWGENIGWVHFKKHHAGLQCPRDFSRAFHNGTAALHNH